MINTNDLQYPGSGALAGEPELVAALNAGRGELAERLGIVLTGADQDRVTGTMPVQGNRQPFGLLHGGASAALAETLGSIHAVLVAGPGATAVGIELSCSHHRSAKDGTVTGVSTALQVGRTLASFDIVLRDDIGRRICTARLSCLLRPQRETRSPS